MQTPQIHSPFIPLERQAGNRTSRPTILCDGLHDRPAHKALSVVKYGPRDVFFCLHIKERIPESLQRTLQVMQPYGRVAHPGLEEIYGHTNHMTLNISHRLETSEHSCARVYSWQMRNVKRTISTSQLSSQRPPKPQSMSRSEPTHKRTKSPEHE
jgi:hypothetical protein